MSRTVLVVAALALLGACSNNVGPNGLLVGAACIDQFDCVTGAYCTRRSIFPDGMCTTSCDADTACRAGAVCVDLEGGLCALSCTEDADCGRPGFLCGEERAIDGATVRICRS